MIKEYILSKLKIILLVVLFIVVFLFICLIQAVSALPLLFSSLIMLAVLIPIVFLDYVKHRDNTAKMSEMKKDIVNTVYEMPEANNATEKGYHDLLKELDHNYRLELLDKELAKTELTEFVDIWQTQLNRLFSDTDYTDEKRRKASLRNIERKINLIHDYVKVKDIDENIFLQSHNLENIVSLIVRKNTHVFVDKKLKVEINNCDLDIVTDDTWLAFVLQNLLDYYLRVTMFGVIVIEAGVEEISIKSEVMGLDVKAINNFLDDGYELKSEDSDTAELGLLLAKKVADKIRYSLEFTLDNDVIHAKLKKIVTK